MQTRAAERLRRSCHDHIGAVVTRLRAESTLSSTNPPVAKRHAAVLIPLFEGLGGDVRVLLCRRAQKLSTHGGEVALPGGKRDDTDTDDIHTALREAEEELGLTDVDVLGKLKPVLSKHFLSVTPVLGRIASLAGVKPNAAEVDAVFDVPLCTFLSADPSVYSFRDTTKSFGNGISYRLHFFQCGEFCVWGLTAGILIEAARTALDREPEFQVTAGSGGGREYTDIIFDDDNNRVMYRQQPGLM